VVEQADSRIHQLKQQRKALSRQLQTQMHASYYLTNFVGESLSLALLQGRYAYWNRRLLCSKVATLCRSPQAQTIGNG
jgi:hypothetical protein